MDKISILQLGTEDWNRKYILPDYVSLVSCADPVAEVPKQAFDLVFLDRTPAREEIGILFQITKAHTLFVTEHIVLLGEAERLYHCKKGQRIAAGEIQNFLSREARFYYPKGYGEKFDHQNLTISSGFCGSVKWNGNYNVVLNGDYGTGFRQIACWRNTIPIDPGQVIDLWLEYRRDPGVSVRMTVTQFAVGSFSGITSRLVFDEKELDHVIRIENNHMKSNIFVSLHAKGSGELRIIALHDRYSRGDHGYFLPGGERYVTSAREEIFCYFDPGDRKPPLNVYFAGYKTQQNFEGYNIMRRMGCPFLLLSEPRLQGGCVYEGTDEYEQLVTDMIKKHIDELGFQENQVILSGISGGSHGALKYGCAIRPHTLILGKPVANMGYVAANEKHLRSGGFPPALDMLLYLKGDTDEQAVAALNDRFWKKFDATDWSRSEFIVAYMLEDDYDPNAYEQLISHLQSEGVQVYGKGIHGRHNDNTGAIVSWFLSQFERVLREDFGRRMKK